MQTNMDATSVVASSKTTIAPPAMKQICSVVHLILKRQTLCYRFKSLIPHTSIIERKASKIEEINKSLYQVGFTLVWSYNTATSCFHPALSLFICWSQQTLLRLHGKIYTCMRLIYMWSLEQDQLLSLILVISAKQLIALRVSSFSKLTLTPLPLRYVPATQVIYRSSL